MRTTRTKRLIHAAIFGTGTLIVLAGPAAASTNLVSNGSFEQGLDSFKIGGTVGDGAFPVAIDYNQVSNYPTGAQGEAVPTDNALSASPDSAGNRGVYFVTDEAENLSLYQSIYLTPGSYDIGFDSYETFNGSMQPHDAVLTANIAGTKLADFSLSSVGAGSWSTHAGEALITTAGNYLVSFGFQTPDTPPNPDPTNPGGIYNAKDVILDRVYVTSDANGGGTPVGTVPELGTWAMMILGFGVIGWSRRRASRKLNCACDPRASATS